MDSFFLSETTKYLYLLFDHDNFVNKGNYIFTTEAHILPMNMPWHKVGSSISETCSVQHEEMSLFLQTKDPVCLKVDSYKKSKKPIISAVKKTFDIKEYLNLIFMTFAVSFTILHMLIFFLWSISKGKEARAHNELVLEVDFAKVTRRTGFYRP
eukprot:TRINITY_DN680_c1_g3_i1.p1 TRINITY_DN680_c1_g3~~TRINITY_DN680_c1_g3_i1.p1  ORF type:complete len:154 (-),score=17.76 TRINITY_DN680_c1_g3_i1:54-515(-)